MTLLSAALDKPSVIPTAYIGRFAPSPTGPLHFGSLLAAIASYADARSQHGQWLVRMEDLDPPREMPGAADHILSTLETFGFQWDGDVLYQSQRQAIYQAVVDQLIDQQQAYRCDCSRQQIQQRGASHYDDFCRNRHLEPSSATPTAVRVTTDDRALTYTDRIQGCQSCTLHSAAGDFVIRRKDGPYAYQLAVVIDDYHQGVSHIVRGSDLLDSTPRQLHLQQLLDYPSPSYGHIPVVINPEGQKLSKQTFAPALDPQKASALLVDALAFLGQHPDSALLHAQPEDVLQWAIEHWRIDAIPQQMQMGWESC